MKSIVQKYSFPIGIVLVVYVIYQFGLSNTLQEYRSYKEAEERLEKAKTASDKIHHLNAEMNSIQEQLSQYTIDSLKNKEYIFNTLAEFCKNTKVKLREFPQEGSYIKGNYVIETNKIVAEGQYKDLLKLLHHIEFKEKIGRISSVSFYTYKDHQKQKNILLMNMYIQTIGEKL